MGRAVTRPSFRPTIFCTTYSLLFSTVPSPKSHTLLVGNYENKGRQWRPVKSAVPVNGHDFPDPAVPWAYPYGIYDIGHNTGFVNVGTDRDTGAFAVASIRCWWWHEGRHLYPRAGHLLITADGGGSNGTRLQAWKLELQRWANESGLTISVCHFPPGTSKWNKVEHRLFSFISSNWRGEPLKDYETIVCMCGRPTLRCRAEGRVRGVVMTGGGRNPMRCSWKSEFRSQKTE